MPLEPAGRRDAVRPATGIVVTFPDGRTLPLLHLRYEHLRSLDALIHRIESGFGYAQVTIAHGRIAGYDKHETIRVLDDLVGLGGKVTPPAREGAA